MVLEAIFEKGDKIGWIWPFVNIVLCCKSNVKTINLVHSFIWYYQTQMNFMFDCNVFGSQVHFQSIHAKDSF